MSLPFQAFRGITVAVATIGVAAGAAWTLGPRDAERGRVILFAAAVCLAGSAGTAVAACVPATTAAARAALPLLGIALRLGPALAALAWLQAGGDRFRTAGAGPMLVGFYLAALAADVVRIIMWERDSGRTPRGSGPN